jgi:hypothetical protein
VHESLSPFSSPLRGDKRKPKGAKSRRLSPAPAAFHSYEKSISQAFSKPSAEASPPIVLRSCAEHLRNLSEFGAACRGAGLLCWLRAFLAGPTAMAFFAASRHKRSRGNASSGLRTAEKTCPLAVSLPQVEKGRKMYARPLMCFYGYSAKCVQVKKQLGVVCKGNRIHPTIFWFTTEMLLSVSVRQTV